MAMFRTVQVTFWTDAKITDEFTPEDKYFYLYLFTNPHTNLCGCYEISIRQVAWETGYSQETISRLIDRFETVHHVIRYNSDTREVLLVNWGKHNWTSSDKYRKPLLKEIELVKSPDYREFLMAMYNGEDTVSIPYRYRMDTTNTLSITNTDSNTDSKKEKKAKRFVPPTVDDVKEYCRERNNNVNPDSFVNFYESKGWKVGKEPMKDWKAAVRTWEQRDREEPRKPKNQSLEFAQRTYTNDEIDALERRKLGLA